MCSLEMMQGLDIEPEVGPEVGGGGSGTTPDEAEHFDWGGKENGSTFSSWLDLHLKNDFLKK